MVRTKTDLLNEVKSKGLWKGGVESLSREELMDLMAKAADLPQLFVMLAKDMKDLSGFERAGIVAPDSEWVFEEKLDGVRMKMHMTSNGIRLDGRRRSVETYIFTERTGNFPHFQNFTVPKELHGAVLDTELLMTNASIDTGSVITAGTLTSTTAVTTCSPGRAIGIQKKYGPAKIFVFDLICAPGSDGVMTTARFSNRRAFLEKVFEKWGSQLNSAQIFLVPQTEDGQALYNRVLEADGEGVMAKRKRGLYLSGQGDKRSPDVRKWKKVYTIDAFVTGYVPAKRGHGWEGLVGALEVSVIDERGKEVQIGACQPGTLDFRRQCSAGDGSLKKEYYGKVVEIQGNEWTKNLKLRHCILLRWRPDKGKEECVKPLNKYRRKLAIVG